MRTISKFNSTLIITLVLAIKSASCYLGRLGVNEGRGGRREREGGGGRGEGGGSEGWDPSDNIIQLLLSITHFTKSHNSNTHAIVNLS